MKSRINYLLVGCVLLLAGTYCFTASAHQQDDGQEGATGWAHLALSHNGADLGGDLAKKINRLGDEGWQLVCVTAINKEGSTEKTIYYFKRPK